MQPAGNWTGDTDALRAVQRLAVPAVVTAARALSFFGEHAAGWLAIGAIGAIGDRPRRREWLTATAQVALAHGASVVVKRIIRRPRPRAEGIRTLAGTYSACGFPSAHAASTTAAAIAFGRVTGRNLTAILVPPMLVSRLVLGVHYPTDVLAGSVLGAVIGTAIGTPRRPGVAA